MDKNIEKRPEITVLMPVYNGERYVSEAIQSILSQTFSNFEFLIINDGSKDNTSIKVKSFSDHRITFIENNANRGLIYTLNLGLEKARGRYIARIDHDDIAYPDRLKIQYDFLESHPEISLVGSWAEVFGTGTKRMIRPTATNPKAIKFELLFGNFMFHSSIFFRKESAISAGGYEKQYIGVEDYNLYMNLLKKGSIANIPQALIKYRQHNESITSIPESQKSIYKNTLLMMERNVSQYIKLSNYEIELLTKIIIVRHPEKTSLPKTYHALRLLRRIKVAFVRLEKLNESEILEVQPWYRNRVKLIVIKYLISVYHSLIRK